MSSLEMVDYINAMRQPGESELQYGHFMSKVPKVLGEIRAFEFSQVSFFINGAGHKVPRQVFNFPKREACLMAMSYSYDLQAKVYDRMTALEAGMVALAVPSGALEGTALRLLCRLPAGAACRCPKHLGDLVKAALYAG